MKSWAWALIGLGAAAVVVTGVGVAEHYAHASSGKCKVPSQLQSGHRYKIVIVDPNNTQPIPNATAFQALFNQALPNTVNVVAVDPLGTTSATIIVDITGQSVQEPANFCQQLASLGPGASITVTDMGATPGGG